MDVNVSASTSADNVDDSDGCPICLNPFSFPVELKCKHKFCFLCLKGVSLSNQKCPLCRKKISKELLEKPKFLNEQDSSIVIANDGDYKWFYKGSGGGWWLYDKDTNDFIENAYRNNQTECHISLIGLCYVVDFAQMMQYRVDVPGKKRRVKRDTYNKDDSELKGLAGISKMQLESLKRKKKPQMSPTKRQTRSQTHSHT
ncbi:E3 ubiquitin-protein ligase rnf146-like protein [Leptotrombidium deliense]|uniref:E3 ubiquitin-protein ligase n=1 Tax=Leptotrombidium deliense TaxID=299467 RepID=A0A443SN37_9ACAR|nr:E3 ubiquitin-protein ligase rnf146-like protein [Leptotrombidium deliense]